MATPPFSPLPSLPLSPLASPLFILSSTTPLPPHSSLSYISSLKWHRWKFNWWWNFEWLQHQCNNEGRGERGEGRGERGEGRGERDISHDYNINPTTRAKRTSRRENCTLIPALPVADNFCWNTLMKGGGSGEGRGERGMREGRGKRGAYTW